MEKSETKRYVICQRHQATDESGSGNEPCLPSGNTVVLASDFDALSAQVRELREENERLRINVKPVEDEVHRLCAAAGVIADDYERLKQSLAIAREDAAYYKWRLQEIMPLFQEARDALPAINLATAKLRGLSLDLDERMDAAGTRNREQFRALKPTTEAGGGETIPKCLECGVPVPRSATYCGVCEIL
jgi:chromosome segregation ATPase